MFPQMARVSAHYLLHLHSVDLKMAKSNIKSTLVKCNCTTECLGLCVCACLCVLQCMKMMIMPEFNDTMVFNN